MSLIIKTLPVGQLTTNCYVVIDEKTQQAVIIDPGDAAEFIINTLRDAQATPIMIVATHGHFDHILAVTELQLAYEIPFLIHADDRFLVARMQQSAQHFLGITTDPPPRIDAILGDVLTIGAKTFTIIHTPGHTPGSVCLYYAKQKMLLSGDTIFADNGVGRVDFSYSSSADLRRSVGHVMQLPGSTMVYPGHGGMALLGGQNYGLTLQSIGV